VPTVFAENQLTLYRHGKFAFAARFDGQRVSDVLVAARVQFGDESIAQLRSHTGRPLRADAPLHEQLSAELEPGFVVCLGADEQFVWPALRVGESVRVKLHSDDGTARIVRMHTVSTRPRVFLIPSLLSLAECDELAAIGKSTQLDKSKVGADTGKGGEYRDVRTSSQTWIAAGSPNDTPTVKRVRDRVFDLMKMPVDLGEALQLVHYNVSQHYFGHHDYSHIWESVDSPYVQAGGNRFITVVMYLNDVEAGGETVFPFANSTNRPRLDEHGKEQIWVIENNEHVYFGNPGCDGRGLQVPPIKGAALVFYNLLEEHTAFATPDSYTLHAGCDVLKGEKFAAQQWIRNKRVGGVLY
jgi:prolyl 4-hydroxylase